MKKTLLYSITLVLCFGTCIISAKEGSDIDSIISGIETANYTTVDTDVNKEVHFNASETEAARLNLCTCENGKCVRMCDLEKTTPCTDKRRVCICDPEFGKKSDELCDYCYCGHGFNCTFTWRSFPGYWEKSCTCPEGYYEDIRLGRCRATCSDKQPCQNGGKCSRSLSFYQIFTCNCPEGTSGDLCEEIDCSACGNRLEVDCIYDRSKHTSYCSCKNSSLYYDYEQKICKPCPCGNGNCEYDISDSHSKLKCNCHPGYKEFNGYCKKCECDFRAVSGCEFDSKGERICRCPDGFYERNGLCLLCGCTMGSIFYTKCEMSGNVKRCFCGEGYQDVLGHCEDINECETNNTCHSTAECHNAAGTFYCVCPEGYRGSKSKYVEPGEVCQDINECEERPSICWYADNVKCVNLPGTYKCECFHGYKPSRYSEEPSKTACVKDRKNWGPAVIVICTSLVLIALSLFVHKRLRNRAANSN